VLIVPPGHRTRLWPASPARRRLRHGLPMLLYRRRGPPRAPPLRSRPGPPVRVHNSWTTIQPTQEQRRSGVPGEQHSDNTNETALFSPSGTAANMTPDKPNTLVKRTECGYWPFGYRAGQTFL
jgi:hypothetical protein